MPIPETAVRRRPFPARVAAALRLDASLFEEVEHDAGALPQAAAVVLLAGLARGAGAAAGEGAASLIASAAAGLLFWLVAAAVIWAIGVHALKGSAGYRELLRTLGFAAAPLCALALAALPLGFLRTPWVLALHGWALLAMLTAVREALDVSTQRAALVCLLGALAAFLLLALLGILCAPQTAAL
jgi:hypothetical protein